MANLGLKSIETALHSPGIHYRNPTIPSSIIIPGMTDGSKLYISGCVGKAPKRFSLNLQRGESEGSDIFFHMDARFDEEGGYSLVRNAVFGGNWGEEERDVPHFPFEERKAFIMCITANNDKFTVEIDGNEYFTFPNRNEAVSNITHLSLFGTVRVSEIHIPFIDNQSRRDFMATIPGYARIGDLLIVRGKTPSGRDRFAVNLTTGPSPDDNIAYHFNARFQGDDMLVLNHRAEGDWGEEVRVNDTDDFKVSSHLDDINLVISIEENGLNAYINDYPIHVFTHRIGLNSIKNVSFEKDLMVNDVHYYGFPSKGDRKVQVIKTGKFPVPFNAEITPGKSIVVSGLVPQSPKRFYVNLQLSNKDIAMHFNPRWDDPKCQGECLIVNTKTNGEWGTEIREPLPLTRGLFYELIFKFNGQNEIEISIDGCAVNLSKVAKISHAFNNSDITQIEVGGAFEAKQIACIY